MDWSTINFLAITNNITGILTEILPQALFGFAIIVAISIALAVFEELSDTPAKKMDRYYKDKLK
jgi:hypothetical protein